jgi:hypothetical protein
MYGIERSAPIPQLPRRGDGPLLQTGENMNKLSNDTRELSAHELDAVSAGAPSKTTWNLGWGCSVTLVIGNNPHNKSMTFTCGSSSTTIDTM